MHPVQHHALAVPAPAQGHLMPLMRFCSILAANHGFRITIVNIDAIHKRIAQQLQERTTTGSELHNDDDDDDDDSLQRIGDNMWQARLALEDGDIDLSDGFDISFKHMAEVVNACLPPALERLVCKINASVKDPRITCLISDAFVTRASQKLADKFGLPRVALYPSCQSFNLWSYYLINGDLPSDEVLEMIGNRSHFEKTKLDEIFQRRLEGLPAIRNRDLPHFQHKARDETADVLRVILPQASDTYTKAHAIVVNSVEELESEAFSVLRRRLRNIPVLPVGPLLDINSKKSTSSAACLWKEDESSLDWLDQQSPCSVVYIAFGSITCLAPTQLQEILAGLVSSQQRFLWVFRPDLVDTSANVDSVSANKMTPEFILRNAGEGKGCVVSWAPQLRVLSHPAIGAFITHCGWNSTVEALANGVPMLCWPYFADQMIDARLIVETWKVGLAFDEDFQDSNGRYLVSRNEVEKKILAVMEGIEGKDLRRNAARLKESCAKSLMPNGSSYQNIRLLVDSLSS